MKKFVAFLFFATALQTHAFTLSTDGELSWPGKTVTFYLDPSNCPSNVLSALNAAIKLWNGVPTSKLELKYGGNVSTTPASLVSGSATSLPVIVCDPNFSTHSGSLDADFVGAFGFLSSNTYGGVVVNVQSGRGGNVNNYTSTQLEILMAHEIGHVLGIGHSEYEPALMYYDIGSKSTLNLAQDDIDAVTYLYPRDEFSDGMYGCARVSGATPPHRTGTLLLLVFPLMCALILRWQQKRKKEVLSNSA